MHIREGSPAFGILKGHSDKLTGNPTEPWISREAIERLRTLLKPDMVGIEWGSGSSTIWYAQRLKELHTYESSEKWSDRLRDYITKHFSGPDLHYYCVPPTQSGRTEFLSSDGKYYEEYCRAADAPKEVDVIFIDGRSRSACIREAVKRLKSSKGVLVLDDAKRDRYDVSVIPERWKCEKYYNEVFTTKIWISK
jgi:predicted O-methyltransferase YrrM